MHVATCPKSQDIVSKGGEAIIFYTENRKGLSTILSCHCVAYGHTFQLNNSVNIKTECGKSINE